MENRKFQNTRLITIGVNQRISEVLQALLWELADGLEEQDYLQIFELRETEQGIFVLHRQEEPPYESRGMVYGVKLTQPHEKVYIIDDGTHATMLLAEEY